MSISRHVAKTFSGSCAQAEGREIPAHKAVLAAHSPFFAQQFSANPGHNSAGNLALEVSNAIQLPFYPAIDP